MRLSPAGLYPGLVPLNVSPVVVADAISETANASRFVARFHERRPRPGLTAVHKNHEEKIRR
jgi:hypothetical protein